MENRIEMLRRPLSNITCPYCGRSFDDEPATKEHVVGRRFVPKGTLYQSLNVILNAHRSCNQYKGDLEDDLSAVSMYPDLGRGFEGRGEVIASEARRKVPKSFVRGTHKKVAESSGEITINGSLFPGLNVSFTMVSPPQMDERRVYELAHHHIRGFFYALTYDPQTHLGGFWLGGFHPLIVSLRMDWGNPIQQWFMTTVSEWLPRIIGSFASEHFGVAIRRHPSAEAWSWALEWNRNVRVVGFFGHDETILELMKDVPDPEMDTIGRYPDGGVLRMRSEVPLDANGDSLFRIPE